MADQNVLATFFTKHQLTISNSPRVKDQQKTAPTSEEKGRSSNPFSFSFFVEENTTSRDVFETNGFQGQLQSKTQRRRKRRTNKKHNNIDHDPNNVSIALQNIQKGVSVKKDAEITTDTLPAQVVELEQDVNQIITAVTSFDIDDNNDRNITNNVHETISSSSTQTSSIGLQQRATLQQAKKTTKKTKLKSKKMSPQKIPGMNSKVIQKNASGISFNSSNQIKNTAMINKSSLMVHSCAKQKHSTATTPFTFGFDLYNL